MTVIVTTVQDTNSNVFQNVASWCNVDALSGVPKLGDSLNVSSLTDTAVGIHATNFTNSFNATTYLFKVSPGTNQQGNPVFAYGTALVPATGSSPWNTSDSAGAERDRLNSANYALGALA